MSQMPDTRWRRRTAQALCLGVVMVLLAEATCRWVLGLGTPPLYETDPAFEYRLQPNQDLYRFGNHVLVNRWGMRAADFGATKSSTDEVRVMLVGDSVINGGSQIDQQDLAATRLQRALGEDLRRPVIVGNASAGSWGPGNWLAYAQRFGFFEADVVALVLGSGDAADNPSFAPLGANHPTQAPRLALSEAIHRYLPRYLPLGWANAEEASSAPTNDDTEAELARGLADLQAFLESARANGRAVVVLHHPDRQEYESGQYLPGFEALTSLMQRLNVPFVPLRPHYLAAGGQLYRDGIHTNAHGQHLIASALQEAIKPALHRHPSTMRVAP